MTPEGRVKAAVKKVLSAAGIWFFCPVSNGMGRHGIPDFVCCKPTVITQDMVGSTIGEFVAFETKAPGKRGNVSPLQLDCHDEIRHVSGRVFVVDEASQVKDSIT